MQDIRHFIGIWQLELNRRSVYSALSAALLVACRRLACKLSGTKEFDREFNQFRLAFYIQFALDRHAVRLHRSHR